MTKPQDTRPTGSGTTANLTPQQQATAWNLRHPVGTAVRVQPGTGTTYTRSPAWVPPGRPAVIAVASRRHPVDLSQVEAVTDEPALDGAA